MELTSLRILASAIAGRSVELVPAAAGQRSSTDGRTIFLEADVSDRDQLRLLGVQASLLASGSYAPDVVAALRGHRGLAQRYLAVEGHRALAANEDALPPWMRSMTNAAIDASVGSLELARRDRSLKPPWEFGTVDVGRLVRAIDAPNPNQPVPRIDGTPVDSRDELGLDLLDDDDSGGDLSLLSSPVGGGGPVGKLLAKLLRPSRGRGSGGEAGADSPTHMSNTHLHAGRAVASLATRKPTLDDAGRPSASTFTYPEWDERRRVYRPDWCEVHDDVAGLDTADPVALPDTTALRRALARLGTELTPRRRQRQGGDLDIDAVVQARVDRIAGGPVVDDVYIDTLRQARGLSVLVLLDVSGSAAEPGVAGRTVHDHQREAAAALVTALHQLGDRVALHAFNSRGRSAVQVSRVKSFDDRLDQRIAVRLGGLRPAAFTRLGAAIRHGSALLDAGGGTPRRLLVVLSDGFAYDHAYEGSYGEADAQRALLEARRDDIGCVCLSVGADADVAALQRVFGSAAHAAVPTTDHLAALVGPLFASALQLRERAA